MALYVAHKNNQELIAVTDQFGLFNVFSDIANSLKIFRSFEEVKKHYKCFARINEYSLINYDLNFRDFISQFEDASKECDDLAEEVEKWKVFKEKLKLIRK